MRQVLRKEFWSCWKQLELWHKNGVRYRQFEILEQGDGFQIQGTSLLDAETSELLACKKDRVEGSLHINSEYFVKEFAKD
jgi:hypothetical protein